MVGLVIAEAARPGSENAKNAKNAVTRSCLFLIVLIDSVSNFSTEAHPIGRREDG